MKDDEMEKACGTYGEEQKYIQGVGAKIRRKIPLGRPRCRWEDNTRMNIK